MARSASPERGRQKRWVEFSHSRIPLPWFEYLHKDDPLSRLRRLASELEREGLPVTPWTQSVAAVWHLARVLQQSFRAVGCHGKAARDESGKGRWQQWREMVRYALRLNTAAGNYYRDRRYRFDTLAEQALLLDHRFLSTLHHFSHRQRVISPLDNKIHFEALCEHWKLPCVNSLWVFGATSEPNNASEAAIPPETDLILKPACGWGGHGVSIWTWQATTQSYTSEQVAGEYKVGELLNYARSLASHCPYLLQAKQTNAPELQSFTNGSLANYRVITAIPPGGTPEIISGALRMPAGSDRLANTSQGSVASSIDLQTGHLHAAERPRQLGRIPNHPDTGARIAGIEAPLWKAVSELALEAHLHFNWFPSVGWDVVCTRDGIKLLEGNEVWGGLLTQFAGQDPLGKTRFPEIYLQYLEQGEFEHPMQPPEEVRDLLQEWDSLRGGFFARKACHNW